MRKIINTILIICAGMVAGNHVYAQSDKSEKELLVVDDVQIDVKTVQVDPKTKTALVELFLISYTRNGRELKLNTYGTKIVDSKGSQYFFSTIGLDKVLVKSQDKQNYINYLMKMDEPVILKMTVSDWVKEKGKPKELILVFEDSEEEGHYIETAVQL
ncbi:hypothetical protein LZQ00_17495 [Sphingobacterium sp. SRCM116780]|uniref:hypothetical protein n=1 Tax=Sphingobacterium sp. SRCM116780 TaxID=2907623 RepID=UPI001F25FE41|nr:hypothetical protein [Sphingobacterium sp. SRCM116780]UIR56046.1 hypothetical protein LZQ00_17495 [Sphingobacterium sp. SRCM116780]